MEKQIDIAEILASKSRGLSLYSPIFGECNLYKVDEQLFINVRKRTLDVVKFSIDGSYSVGGECMLFPSKEMRDWSKFSWKKGDVLVSNDGRKETIFIEFTDDTYTSFKAKHSLVDNCYDGTEYIGDEDCLATQDYSAEDNDEKQCYLNTIEERLGGKLNLETFEVEPAKPKCGFKPFQQVIVRKKDGWTCDFFSHKDDWNHYVTMSGNYEVCLPYNEETAHLIGTTDNWED